MGKCLLATPNYIKSRFYPTVMGGGNWSVSGPLDNLKGKFFINAAISETAMASDTQMHVHFGAERDVKVVAIQNSDITKAAGRMVVRASNAPAWTGRTVTGAHLVGASTLYVNDTTGIMAGEVLTIAGDSTVYDITTVSGPTTLEIRNTTDKTGLLHTTAGDEAITCHSGKYGGVEEVYNSGIRDYYGVVYPPGILTWGSPGLWDGKETDENLFELDLPRPFVHILPNPVTAAYWHIAVTDEANPNGGVTLDALHITAGYSPIYNMEYGAVQGLTSNTTKEESAGGAEIFGEEASGRYVDFMLKNGTVNDAFVNIFDLQRRLDIHDDLFFIYDVDDTALMTRRAFVGRLEDLSELGHAAFDSVDAHFRIKEKLA